MKIRELLQTPLPLTNEGILSVFTLGCGSAFTKKLNQNNIILVKGNDHIMIDCGTKSTQALYELGLSITDIHNFLITHSHADHIGGLEEAMLMGRYVARRKPNIVITEQYEKLLWDFSLKGGASYNEIHDGRTLEFADMWEVTRPTLLPDYPRETYEANIGALNLKMFRTNHYPEQSESWQTSFYSVGVLADERFFFSGDTKFDPELLSDLQERFRIEVIFQDVQFFPKGVHAFVDELATLPATTRGKMYLMHYPDDYEQYANKVKELGFAGFVIQNRFYDFP